MNPFLTKLLELLWAFIEKLLKRDPSGMTFAELMKVSRSKKFRDWAAKQ